MSTFAAASSLLLSGLPDGIVSDVLAAHTIMLDYEEATRETYQYRRLFERNQVSAIIAMIALCNFMKKRVLLRHFCSLAAEYGHISILRAMWHRAYDLQVTMPWCSVYGSDTPLGCTSNGQLNCLIYIHKHGCTLGTSAMDGAAKNGSLVCIRYIYADMHVSELANFYPAAIAARRGHLDCLHFLRRTGFSMTSFVVEWAAKSGHLNCLQYALDNGRGVLMTRIS